MSVDSVKRFDRIIAILVQLQSKRIVKAQELADRFTVSLRTIYRDIRTLEASGVPIVSEAGIGYSIMDGYRLPPVMFTREEAGSFVAAEKFMQQFLDESLGSYHQSAMYKVKSVLRGAQKDWISALESQITVAPSQELFNKQLPHALEILFESIAEKKQVFLKYSAINNEVTERFIEPIGLFHEYGYWYLLAYCHSRKSNRNFRTDRMLAVNRTQHTFTIEHQNLSDYRNKEHEEPKTKVIISVDKAVTKYIKSSKKYYGFVSEVTKGNFVEMTFMTNYADNGFARWFLMFADNATILEPDSLKTRIKEILTAAINKLQKTNLNN